MKKKKKFRPLRTLCAVCLTIAAALLPGCKSSNVRFSKEEILDYMKERYGESFQYVDLFYTTRSAMKLRLTCNSLPGKEVVAECVAYGDSKVFSDNYINVKYEDRIRDTMHELAVQVYGDCRVWYQADVATLDPGYPPDMSFADYVCNPTNDAMDCILFIAPGYDIQQKNADLDTFVSLLKEHQFLCDFKIYFVNDAAAYAGRIEDMTSRVDNSSWLSDYGVVLLDENFDFKSKRWGFE